MKRKNSILLIAAMTITLAACDSKVQERTVIKKGDKTITVLEAESKASNEELKVEKVEEYKNINALDWQDEDKLLISQENTNVEEVQLNGMKYTANNFFVFDTSTGKSKVLREESADQSWAEFSQDKKHILFKKSNFETEGSYIMDSQGQNEVSITGDEPMPLLVSRWIDDKRVIYVDFTTGVVNEVDISGKIFEIADLKVSNLNEVWKIGDEIYYIPTGDDNLVKYNLTSKEKSQVEENVCQIFPATDENRIAYTKYTDGYRSQLLVCDKNFNNKKIIDEDQMISEVKWSPDNTKLLYLTSQSSDTAGINVADQKTGKTTRVALNTNVSNLSWSPSGKKIAVSQFNEDGTSKSAVFTLSN